MARERKGSVITRSGSIYARLRFVDKFGKTKAIEQKALNRSDAKAILKQMLRKLEDKGPTALQAEKVTFEQLADLYKEKRLVPAEYSVDAQGQPLSKHKGLRSLASPLQWCELLRNHFGKMKLKDLTYSDISDFRSLRINTRTVHKTPRSITTVNRELAVLRAMLNFAIQNELIVTSPFKKGPALISKADENKRDRVLSHFEEARLLAKCQTEVTRKFRRKRDSKDTEVKYKSRRHLLHALIVTALDTALRKNELLTLRWSDIDMISWQIHVLAFNSKTALPRSVGMTPRVIKEFQKLYSESRKDPADLVFGIRNNLDRSFKAACVDAKITGLSFHDLRHTATTRLVQAGTPTAIVMKITGHTQMTTFQRYVNPDTSAVTTAANALAAFNLASTAKQPEQPAVEFIN